MLAVVLVLGAYLTGAIPFGLVVGRAWAGVDVRQVGSGNIGAANVARTVGKGLGVLVLVLDALKGALPTLAALVLFPASPWLPVATGGAALLGHLFPVYLRFRGGKGVATSLGVFAVLSPWAVLAGLAAFALGFLATRTVSAGSLLGTATASTVAFITLGVTPTSGLLAAATAVIVVRHRGNIGRLIRRQERKW